MGLEMTVADLPKLAPRQRQVMELRLQGYSQATVAAMLKIKRSNVPHIEFKARERIKTGFVPSRPRSAPGSPTCHKGHPRTNSRRCKACNKLNRHRWKRWVPPEHRPTPEPVIEVKRCQHPMRRGPCNLLMPCADHETISTGGR